MSKKIIELYNREKKTSKFIYIYKLKCKICNNSYWANYPENDICPRCDFEGMKSEFLFHFPPPTGTPNPDYKEYIKSDLWHEKSLAAKERAEWHCQLCNKEGDEKTLHVHHNTYERLGVELAKDLIVLCEDCHAKFHNKVSRNG